MTVRHVKFRIGGLKWLQSKQTARRQGSQYPAVTVRRLKPINEDVFRQIYQDAQSIHAGFHCIGCLGERLDIGDQTAA
jgi:hypothetical protein